MSPVTPKPIFLTGLLAGTLDITAASIQFYIKTGKGPVTILKFVASGLFGKEAFTGGIIMTIAGLVIHYLIAITFTIFFALLIKHIAVSRISKPATGLLYGAFVWTVMNLLVWPLIKVPPRVPNLSRDLQAMGILILCIGMPLAFLLIQKKKSNITKPIAQSF